MPNIGVSDAHKEVLDDIKLHPRETYDETVSRLLECYEKCGGKTAAAKVIKK